MTFLFAGHETSALGLTYALYCLADASEFQERVHAEISALDGDPTPADLRDCPALTAAVDEALRLYPPVHSFFREPTEPVSLGGYRVPAGVVLTLSPWAVHRDGRWWDRPETYRPERWLREAEDGEVVHGDDRPGPAWGSAPNTPSSRSAGAAPLHRDALRATGASPRRSGTLLRRVRLEPATAELSVRASANTRPAGPIRVRVRTRDESLSPDEPIDTS
ncbi:cytochrome P450 [Halorubrum saccharovorum]|uniref:cytochrome P450 n=1 Tax=Halorubrum saccharovorum TaxID=2248 RepID=UPI0022867DD4|nr:cytochrome P450 [Halorubrum saccharovorum]